jgi:hypothetical protein
MKVFLLISRELFTGNDTILGIYADVEQLSYAYGQANTDGELLGYSVPMGVPLVSENFTEVLF